MTNTNTTKTISFEERKKEFINQKVNTHDNFQSKNANIVYLSNYKKTKFKKEHPKFNIKSNKNKKLISLIVILILFLLIVATSAIKQMNSSQSAGNFSYKDTKITTTEASSYESIIKNVVKKHTNADYVVYVSNLHKNGDLIYAQGYFDVPEEGKVSYDVILDDQSPNSLTINGTEYIK